MVISLKKIEKKNYAFALGAFLSSQQKINQTLKVCWVERRESSHFWPPPDPIRRTPSPPWLSRHLRASMAALPSPANALVDDEHLWVFQNPNENSTPTSVRPSLSADEPCRGGTTSLSSPPCHLPSSSSSGTGETQGRA